MTSRLKPSRGEVLLVQPLDTQWMDPQGSPLPAPPQTDRPAHVVVDLMEETHVQVDVPSMMLSDRKGFVDFNLQSKLPDVQARTIWPTGSLASPLPKAFTLNAVGVASDRLKNLLDQMAVDGRPLVGAWTLSYLMAHWASKRKELPRQGAVFLCLSLSYGMRVVLLQDQVPVFSRLLLAADADALGEDLLQTMQYLVDSRILSRDVPPSFVLLDAAQGLPTALFSRGLVVLPVSEQFNRGVLRQVLALAKAGSPGQVATVFQRRVRLAAQLRQVVLVLSALAGIGLAMTAYGEVQRVFDKALQASQWNDQTTSLNLRAQQVRKKIADSGADVSLMRLTSEVQRTELSDPIRPDALFWQLGQLLQAHPNVILAEVAFAASATPCATASLSVPVQAKRGGVAPAGTTLTKSQTEWRFQLNAVRTLSPRSRQEELINVGRAVAEWSDWEVASDPVRPAGTVAISSQQAGDANVWSWCLRSPGSGAEAGKPQAATPMRPTAPVQVPGARAAVARARP